jgi:hypothetical protein
LAGHDARQPVEIGDGVSVDRLVEGEQSGLVRQQLPDGDRFLAALGELRPIAAHAFVVVEPASRMRERKRHRSEPLGGGVDDHHGVLLPWLAGGLVADAAPQIDHLLPAAIDAACRPELVSADEVLNEGFADRLEALADGSANVRVSGCRHGCGAPRHCTTQQVMKPAVT